MKHMVAVLHKMRINEIATFQESQINNRRKLRTKIDMLFLQTKTLSPTYSGFTDTTIIEVSGGGRAVTRKARNLKVRGSTLGLDEIFVRCFSVSPTHMESEKTEKRI